MQSVNRLSQKYYTEDKYWKCTKIQWNTENIQKSKSIPQIKETNATHKVYVESNKVGFFFCFFKKAIKYKWQN